MNNSLSDGDAVGEWKDLSGNGNDATQNEQNKTPILKTNEFGLKVIEFQKSINGTNSPYGTVYGKNSLSFSTENSPKTLYVVAKESETGIHNYLSRTSGYGFTRGMDAQNANYWGGQEHAFLYGHTTNTTKSADFLPKWLVRQCITKNTS